MRLVNVLRGISASTAAFLARRKDFFLPNTKLGRILLTNFYERLSFSFGCCYHHHYHLLPFVEGELDGKSLRYLRLDFSCVELEEYVRDWYNTVLVPVY